MGPGGGAGSLLTVEEAGSSYNLGDWSPDGSRIVFSRQTYPDNYRNIYLMDSDGSNQVALTSASPDEFDPVWSPDGQWILLSSYCSNCSGNPHSNTYLLEVIKGDGSSGMIFGSDKHHPHWIP